jgi:hypothetical protein
MMKLFSSRYFKFDLRLLFITSIFSFPATLLAKEQKFTCQPKGEISWKILSPGVSWAQYTIQFTPYFKESHSWGTDLSRHAVIRVLKVDYAKNQLLFHRAKQDLDCNPARDTYIRKLIDDSGSEVIGAINSNFFIMPNGGTLGISLDEKKLWSGTTENLTISSAGVFGINHGVPFLTTRDDFVKDHGLVLTETESQQFSFLVQAYPKLLRDGELQITDGVKDVKCSRTSIGVDAKTAEILLVTLDTGAGAEASGMTLYEFANLLRDEACGLKQGLVLNLDGGGSTSFAIPSLGIYEQGDRCRHLGNILTVQKR